jgi:hypothetical protein
MRMQISRKVPGHEFCELQLQVIIVDRRHLLLIIIDLLVNLGMLQ